MNLTKLFKITLLLTAITLFLWMYFANKPLSGCFNPYLCSFTIWGYLSIILAGVIGFTYMDLRNIQENEMVKRT